MTWIQPQDLIFRQRPPFGSAYVIFVQEEVTCDDMWWVTTTNLDQEEAPISDTLNVFQIHIMRREKEVLAGSFSVGGQSPVKGEYIVMDGETQSVRLAIEGILEVDEVIENTSVSGSLILIYQILPYKVHFQKCLGVST